MWSLGIVEHAQIVRRLGGHLDDIPLTISRDNPARISSVEGGAGLRLRLGVEGGDLIADIRAIARMLREERPSPELEFVEHVVPVDDPSLLTSLEAALDDLLGREPTGVSALRSPPITGTTTRPRERSERGSTATQPADRPTTLTSITSSAGPVSRDRVAA